MKTSDSPQLTFAICNLGHTLNKIHCICTKFHVCVGLHACLFLQCKHMLSSICSLIETISFPVQSANQPAFLYHSAPEGKWEQDCHTLLTKTLDKIRTHADTAGQTIFQHKYSLLSFLFPSALDFGLCFHSSIYCMFPLSLFFQTPPQVIKQLGGG